MNTKPQVAGAPFVVQRRRGPSTRRSWLGVLVALAFACAVMWIIAPWSFFLGGRFHISGNWSGWGRLHSAARGGDYLVYVQMSGFSAHSGRRASVHYSLPNSPTATGVYGTASICTPAHEQIPLRLSGGMRRNLKLSTNNEAIRLYLRYSPTFSLGDTEPRPQLEVFARWQNPNLVGDDNGSLSRAFLPDGRVNHGRLPAAGEKLPITLQEGSYSDFKAACASMSAH